MLIFRYTKPLQLKTTPILKNDNSNIATFMKVKIALVYRNVFQIY